jgi:hypothetical protein
VLECRVPGDTSLVIEIDGVQQGRVPIDNLLKAHAQLDEGAADEAQRQIMSLRTEVGDWKSRYYDQSGNEAMLHQLQGDVEAAKRRQAAAESELAHLRQTIQPPGDPELVATHRILLRAARAHVGRCQGCRGSGQTGGRPCLHCSSFREIIAIVDPPSHEHDAARVERGQAELDACEREKHSLVFMLHPGIGRTEPYWDLANERDQVVAELRAGKLHNVDDGAPFPPAWASGRFLALVPGLSGDVWAEVTQSVSIDRVEGLERCPSWLRERYRAIAESR